MNAVCIMIKKSIVIFSQSVFKAYAIQLLIFSLNFHHVSGMKLDEDRSLEPREATSQLNAYLKLGQMLIKGEGGEQDYSRAREFFLRAADQEHELAVQAWGNIYLAMLYHLGLGIEKNQNRAESYCDRASQVANEKKLAEVVELSRIMKHEAFNIDEPPRCSCTPLYEAAYKARKEILESHLKKDVELAEMKLKVSPMLAAAWNGYGAVMELLLAKGAAINAANKYGFAPLHWAAYGGNRTAVELLLEKGAELNAANKYAYRTPLYLAARGGNKEVVELLLAKGADVNGEYQNCSGWRPLHEAARLGYKEIVELLLAKGADANDETRAGETPFDLACKEGHKEVELFLVKSLDVKSVRKRYVMGHWENGYTPLHIAASNESDNAVIVVRLLLESGADFKTVTEEGRTPLMIAACYGNKAVVEFLLAKGADLNGVDKNGKNSFHYAIGSGNKKLVESLLASNADPNGLGNDNYTPLHYASESGQTEIVELLLAKGAKVNAVNIVGRTSLHCAASYGHSAVVELLLEKGAAINAVDEAGQTALHHSAYYGRSAVVELLLGRGAALNVADKDGLTPLHVAYKRDHKEIVKLLLAKGANEDARDKRDHVPIYYAK